MGAAAGVGLAAGGIANIATSIIQGVAAKKRAKEAARWIRKRGEVAKRIEGWRQEELRGALRVALGTRGQDSSLHLKLANEFKAGMAVYEAGLPFAMARAQVKYAGKQAMIKGIGNAFSSLASTANQGLAMTGGGGFSLAGMFGSGGAPSSGTLLAPSAAGQLTSRSSILQGPITRGGTQWTYFRASP